MPKIPKILIIAGSDSGAGAGIQADIKAASANGVYSTTAITSITSQNTMGVQAVHNLPPHTVKSQINSVLSDIGADAIKTGMLPTAEIIDMVVDAIQEFYASGHTRKNRDLKNIDLDSRLCGNENDIEEFRVQSSKFADECSYPKIICDPVMVATSGDKLIDEQAIETLKTKLIPISYLLTPNIPEAEILSGIKIESEEDMISAAKKIISDTNINAVLVKGGHLNSLSSNLQSLTSNPSITDILVYKENNKYLIHKFTEQKIETKNTHGTGCTYSSAIASNLAKGQGLVESIQNARKYLQNALKNSYSVGSGKSGVNHLFELSKIS